jgi:hypothetical protein
VTAGSVRFYDGTSLVATITLNSLGKANASLTASAPSVHQYKAVYVGTPTVLTSSSVVQTVTVTKLPASVAFVTPPVPGSPGTSVTVPVKVPALLSGSPIGSVTLSINGIVVGSAPVNGNGIANVVFPQGYYAGLGAIHLQYSGSSTFAAVAKDYSI